jgi:hypothetical protein
MATPPIAELLAVADRAGSVREAAAALRAQFAPLRVVVTDAFDMRDETPAGRGTRHALYLGASDGHCWTLTDDPATAAAVFITEQG